MYGYVIPDKPNMYIKDFSLYKAFYCGLCKSIGKKCGQCMRFGTNYDMTFLNILAHAVADKDIVIANETCILNPVKKKSIVKNDDLTEKIVDINTILLHYKCVDDVIDNHSAGKKFVDSAVIKKHYNRAKKNFGQLDEYLNAKYVELRKLEKENCASVDIVADKFALMLQQVGKYAFGEKNSAPLDNIMYNIGKWIYCADAIDDIDDDNKKGKYNMFLVGYDYKDKHTFLADKGEELNFVLMSCYKSICDSFDQIKLNKFEGVVTNILWYGILESTKEILRREQKCKKTHI
ncbi:MAG: DUF5685 family protein, partial [Clostridia bacterium]